MLFDKRQRHSASDTGTQQTYKLSQRTITELKKRLAVLIITILGYLSLKISDKLMHHSMFISL